ncbi:hypothetical protein [Actinocrispum sp. NPDC049592]|uniref:hypothetical protein n=1 Tax=Actinocrispum sp. NPDC049592 TaxID=3154835 RepID=UPI003426CC34
MPPPRRRPAASPARRPKVAGLGRHAAPDPADTDSVADSGPSARHSADPVPPADAPSGGDEVVEDAPTETAFDGPVIGLTRSPGRPSAKTRDSGTLVPDEEEVPERPSRSQRRRRFAGAPAAPLPAEPEPRRASASVAEADPETDADLDVDDSVDEVEEIVEPRRPSFLLPIGLVVLALLVAGLGWWFTMKNTDARVGSGNTALADANATKDVVGAAQQAVSGVLSYKFDEMDQAGARAKQYLAGDAVGQYDKSMQALSSQIQSQKLQVTVNPVSVAVVRLNGDDARVLVFADQIGVREDKQPAGGPTQFAMDMHRADGKWKIVKLDFFDGK